jgi:CheY-like chemotaxis protein
MSGGGRLLVSTQPVAFDESYVHSHPEARPGSFVCLRVKDNGCGMDSATMTRIFEPFFTTKEVGKGTGLGLATAYGIVKQHNGWIEVASEIGRGTTFSVFLPAQGEPVRAHTQIPASAPEIRGGKETILIVEDEALLRQMANIILRDCGYQVLEASSGHEAMQLWQLHQQSIDLLLTDMVMPEGMSGMQLAERLLASKPSLRIIFASGYSVDDLDTEFLRAGHAEFLQKPYTHLSLPKAVRECLDKAAAARS